VVPCSWRATPATGDQERLAAKEEVRVLFLASIHRCRR
jgi:hypothetical protein